MACRAVHGRDEDAAGSGEDQGGTQARQCTNRNQRPQVGHRQAEERSSGKGQAADDEHALAAENVRQASTRDSGHDERHRITRQGELDPRVRHAEFAGQHAVNRHEHRAAQPRKKHGQRDCDEAQSTLRALLGLLPLFRRLFQQVCGLLLGRSLLSLTRLIRECFRHRASAQTLSWSSTRSICGTTTKRYLGSSPG